MWLNVWQRDNDYPPGCGVSIYRLSAVLRFGGRVSVADHGVATERGGDNHYPPPLAVARQLVRYRLRCVPARTA